MNFLFIASRMKRWTLFNVFRAAVNFLVGLGLALVALIIRSDDSLTNFQGSPWILPTICLTYLIVLVFNHLPLPSSALYRPWKWFGGRDPGVERSGLFVRPHRLEHFGHHHHEPKGSVGKQMTPARSGEVSSHSGYSGAGSLG